MNEISMTLGSPLPVPRRSIFSPLPPLFAILSPTLKKIAAVNRAKKNGTLTQHELHNYMLEWGAEMLSALGCRHETRGVPTREPSLLVGNHISYVDIPLLMANLPAAFVAKKQLASWPIFGEAMRCAGTVFVDRDSKESRKKVGEALAPRILEDRQSVAVFPSGTTTMDESREWRHGAFLIAKQFNLPVQPFRIRYEPLRPVAFLLDDGFIGHLWSLLRTGTFRAEIEFHLPIRVEDPVLDAAKWWNWAREPLLK